MLRFSIYCAKSSRNLRKNCTGEQVSDFFSFYLSIAYFSLALQTNEFQRSRGYSKKRPLRRLFYGCFQEFSGTGPLKNFQIRLIGSGAVSSPRLCAAVTSISNAAIMST